MINFQIKFFEDLTLPELYEVLALRALVFVVEQKCPYQDADGLDFQSVHILGKGAGAQLLAYARIIPPGGAYADKLALGRVVTHPEIRGKGIGRQLMTKTLEIAEQQFGKIPIQISAQQYLIQFYESLGFVINTDPYLEDNIPHIGMIRR